MADFEQEVTPEQIEIMRAYSEALRTPQAVHHPLMGIANILGAISGSAGVQQAEKLRLQQRRNLFNPNGAVSPLPVTPTPQRTNVAPTSNRQSALAPQENEELRSPENVPLSHITTTSGARFLVSREHAQRFKGLLDDLEASGYRIDPNQSGGYNYRNIAGTRRLSEHASGRAVDVNSNVNARGTQGNIDPNLARTLAAKHGFKWGGDFRNPDPMHFEIDPNFNANKMNLGGPNETAPEAAIGPVAPQSPTFQPTAGKAPAAAPAMPERVAQTSAPAGTPPRIEPDPNIHLLERQLQLAGTMSQDEARKVYDEYKALVGPQQREVPGGTAYYNGRTGDLMYVVPKLGQIPVAVPGVSTQQQFIMGPNGPQILPTGPAGGNNQPNNPQSNSAVQNPNITPNPPPFPNTGNISDLATYGANLQSQNDIAQALARGQATRVNAAIEKSVTAPAALSTLSTIRTATEAANRDLWRGESLGNWVQKVSQYLSNFGLGSVEQLRKLPYSELLTKLNATLASQATQELSARGTNFELDTFMRNFPSLTQSYEGAVMLLDFLQQEQRRAVQIGRLADNLQPNQMGNWTKIVQDFYNKNPIYLNMPGIGRPNTRGYQAPRKITTQTITTPDEARKLPKGVWFVTPDGRLLPGGPE